MYYFLNDSNTERNTVIENAAVKRLDIFARLAIDAKIILMSYDPKWHGYVKRNGQNENQFMALFDYFQDVTNNDETPQTLDSFELLRAFKVNKLDNTHFQLEKNKKIVGLLQLDVNFRVDLVEFLDEDGVLEQEDVYDSRGFLSSTTFYVNGKRNNRLYFSPEGTTKLEEYFDTTGQETVGFKIEKSGELVDRLQDLWWRLLENNIERNSVLVSERREYDFFATHFFKLNGALSVARVYNQRPESIQPFTVFVDRQKGREFRNDSVITIDEYGQASDYQLLTEWRKVDEMISKNRG